ncbi:MAG: DUF481 domain-containing protein [Microscillaceae bacterium]|nr:DUF481 domain-containing protein [Microscillaceae bacterium]
MLIFRSPFKPFALIGLGVSLYFTLQAGQVSAQVIQISADSLELLIARRADSLLQARQKTSAASPPPAFQYSFSIQGAFNEGNVSRQLFEFLTHLSYTKGIVELETNPSFTYGEQNGQLAERDYYGDLNLSLFHERRLYGFAIGIFERSNLRAIRERYYGGGGLGFYFVRNDKVKVSLTNALIYEFTRFVEEGSVEVYRNSTRLKGRYLFFGGKMILSHLLFLQPALNEKENVRWSGLGALSFPIGKMLAFRASIENTYESIVEAGRQKNDLVWSVGLTFGNR